MPERGDKYFHIPVVPKEKFQKGSFRTINITSGVKAVIGRPKRSTKTRIQKFLLSVKKFKTLERAKAWVRARLKKKKPKKSIKNEFITEYKDIKALYGGAERLTLDLKIRGFDAVNRTVNIGASTDDIDAINDRIMFTGLQDIVDAIDRGRDTILFNHNLDRGVGKALNPVNTGTEANFDVYISTTEEEIFTKVQEGVLNGASIAFRPTKVKEDVWYENEQKHVREIHNLDYFETSLVFMPMNEKAGIRYIHE